MLPSNGASRKKRAWSTEPTKLILESKNEVAKIRIAHIRTEPSITEWDDGHMFHFHRLFQWQVV